MASLIIIIYIMLKPKFRVAAGKGGADLKLYSHWDNPCNTWLTPDGKSTPCENFM